MNEAIKDIKPLPTHWYALCQGKGLKVCESCRRNVIENADAAKNPKVRDEVQLAVDRANKSVSRAESIRKFTILPIEWTEDSGHLTPKMSIKRGVILDDFADAVDEIYTVPVTTTNVSLG